MHFSPTTLQRMGVHALPLREHIDQSLTGHGVTMAFIDTGFSPHPDLTHRRARIVAYVDVTGEDAPLDGGPDPFRWHGTQTTCVAAGDGHLSGGVYSGIVPQAEVALVRVVTGDLHVPEENVQRGLEWVLENRERYGIRVVNVSLGVTSALPPSSDAVDGLAAALVRDGVVVTAASGNSGSSSDHYTMPPGNAREVLTFGGFEDHDHPDDGDCDLYWQTSYESNDGVVKPEVLALGGLVPAPVLPGSDVSRRASLLYRLSSASGERLQRLVRASSDELGLPGWMCGASDDAIHRWLKPVMAEDKLVAPHYQHVDGTSFASAIGAGVVAQMLEACPSLTPAMVKYVLVSTADRLSGVPRAHQGFGRVNPRRAVEVARRLARGLRPRRGNRLSDDDFLPPHVDRDRLVFRRFDAEARSVAVAGAFNGWVQAPLSRDAAGLWTVALPLPSQGTYAYKYCMDGGRWEADPSNGVEEDDGLGDVNSVLTIA